MLEFAPQTNRQILAAERTRTRRLLAGNGQVFDRTPLPAASRRQFAIGSWLPAAVMGFLMLALTTMGVIGAVNDHADRGASSKSPSVQMNPAPAPPTKKGALPFA